jgi:hypothetical protein
VPAIVSSRFSREAAASESVESHVKGVNLDLGSVISAAIVSFGYPCSVIEI